MEHDSQQPYVTEPSLTVGHDASSIGTEPHSCSSDLGLRDSGESRVDYTTERAGEKQ